MAKILFTPSVDVMRRQRRAGNIADIVADLQRAGIALAGELRKPARAPDLAAVGLAILQDIHLTDAPAGVEGDRVIDVKMLSDDMIEDEEAKQAAACFGRQMRSGCTSVKLEAAGKACLCASASVIYCTACAAEPTDMTSAAGAVQCIHLFIMRYPRPITSVAT